MTARFDQMKETHSPSLNKFFSSLPGRLVLVVVVAVAASSVIPLFFALNQLVPLPILKWASVALAGIIAGFTARLFLPGSTFLLQFLASLLALLTSLVLLGLMAPGYIGASLPERQQAELNLAWLGQFALGAGLAWLALKAWKASPKVHKPKDSAALEPKRAPAAASTKQTRQPVKTGQSVRSQPSSRSSARAPTAAAQRPTWNARWSQLRLKLDQWWQHGLGEPGVSSSHAAPPASRRISKRKIRMRKERQLPIAAPKLDSPVHLVGEEEHRCPFCLELVNKNDPRGVKICPICRTHHHADCWAVTGTCQVPHFHE